MLHLEQSPPVLPEMMLLLIVSCVVEPKIASPAAELLPTMVLFVTVNRLIGLMSMAPPFPGVLLPKNVLLPTAAGPAV